MKKKNDTNTNKHPFITYLKSFIPGWILIGFFGIITIPWLLIHDARYIVSNLKKEKVPPSTNTERVYGNQRIFDYADQLTDMQEKLLAMEIAETEKIVGYDIVIVTLNESLADYEIDYRNNYSMEITPDKYVMVYADKFWEDNKFGYDCPQVLDGTTNTGDGLILVDNVFREPETGKIYTWLGTTGKAEEDYSDYMIDQVLDAFYVNVDSDYFKACEDFLDKVEFYSKPKAARGSLILIVPNCCSIIVALIVFGFSMLAKRKAITGKNTVTPKTYIGPKGYQLGNTEDKFLGTTTTKRYNPPQSSSGGGGHSSGGGGHHISGGGGSHGGGGHSR